MCINDMNVEEKLLRGSKGLLGRGRTEKGKVAEYGGGLVHIYHTRVQQVKTERNKRTVFSFLGHARD